MWFYFSWCKTADTWISVVCFHILKRRAALWCQQSVSFWPEALTRLQQHLKQEVVKISSVSAATHNTAHHVLVHYWPDAAHAQSAVGFLKHCRVVQQKKWNVAQLLLQHEVKTIWGCLPTGCSAVVLNVEAGLWQTCSSSQFLAAPFQMVLVTNHLAIRLCLPAGR